MAPPPPPTPTTTTTFSLAAYHQRRPGNREDNAIVIDDNDAITNMQIDDDPSSVPVEQHRSRGVTDHQQRNSYAATVSQEKKVRSKLRESRHIAQCVLMDRELLMVHALASHETIPQTRRRFLAQLIAPDDPSLAAAILHADKSAPSKGRVSGSNSPSSPQPSREAIGALLPSPTTTSARGRAIDVLEEEEEEDDGWRSRPTASSSPKGKTPGRERQRLSSSEQQRTQRSRRRKRWSSGGGGESSAGAGASASANPRSGSDEDMDW